MELRHLRYFIAVAEELNFTRAAKRLYIAQPPLSRQIQQLEEETGIRLFERNRGKVFLTDAGRVFLGEAKEVIAQAAHALDSARRAQEGKTGIIRVGIAWGLGDKVSLVLSEFAKHFPEVEIDCMDLSSGQQNDALRLRHIDIGFLRPHIDPLHLHSEELFEESMLVVLRKDNRLAKYKTLRVKQLAGEPLLMIERSVSSGTYDKTLELYRSAGITPRIIPTKTLPYEETGAILVASGKGIYIAVGTNPCHPSFIDRVMAVPLNDADAKIPVHIAWRQGEQPPSVLAFLESVRSIFNLGRSNGASSKRKARAKPKN